MRTGFILTLSILWALGQVIYAGEPITLSDQPQLFLDDHLISSMTNLRRQVHSPAKHPSNPLIRQDFPWEKRMVQVYGTVLYDDSLKKYRCWYLASESPDATPEYYICYAESDDGVTWIKPLIGDSPFGTHEQHNVVIRGGHGISILHTPDDPDSARRFKGVGGDTFAWSPDGLKWTTENCRYAVGKNDTGPSMVRWNGKYLWFVRNQEPETGTSVTDPLTGKVWSGTMRGVGLSVSEDFRTWTRKESILRTDVLDRFPWGQTHALCVTPYGDVLIGLLPIMSLYPEDGNNSFGPWDVQLAVSRDGRSWQRVADRQVFMPHVPETPVPERAWDARFHPASTMLVKDDVVHIYYYGTTKLHGEGRDPASQVQPSRYGIGLATLAADRFVSLRTYDWQRSGTLETKPITVSGSELLINAEVSPDNLRVEMADAAGRPLTGFEFHSSVAIRHDPLRFRIHWNAEGTSRSLADVPRNTPVVLRISIRDGDLFSFRQNR